VPWAETPGTSFLATPEETRGDIAAAGFEILFFRDTSEELAASEPMVCRLPAGGKWIRTISTAEDPRNVDGIGARSCSLGGGSVSSDPI
jgi:hypothetical protein